MESLILYLGMLVPGFILGAVLRKKIGKKIPYSSTIQLITIYTNVVFMGMRIGMNDEIIHNIWTIGLQSFVFTFIILIMVTCATFMGRRFLGFDKYGERHVGKNFLIQKENNLKEKIRDFKEVRKKEDYIMTIMILMSAAVGISIGYMVIYKGLQSGVIFGGNKAIVEKMLANAVSIIIGILIFLVGVDLGYDKRTITNIKNAGFYVFMLPIFNIIGTTIGIIIAVFLCNMNFMGGMAIGQGYAWFTLAPSFLLKYGWVELAAVSFLHNVSREIMSFIFVPLVAKKIGYIECISLSGAAAMDDCMPIIERSTTPSVALYGFISGVLLTFMVPIIVPFFASLV